MAIMKSSIRHVVGKTLSRLSMIPYIELFKFFLLVFPTTYLKSLLCSRRCGMEVGKEGGSVSKTLQTNY